MCEGKSYYFLLLQEKCQMSFVIVGFYLMVSTRCSSSVANLTPCNYFHKLLIPVAYGFFRVEIIPLSLSHLH